jgi:hypothetical protein
MKNQLPLSRCQDIVVQEIKDEILVCDTKNNQVFCLNQTAGEVWKLCDGNTTTFEIAHNLSNKFRTKISEELVLFSLGELSKHKLLIETISDPKQFSEVSRREVIRKIGLGSMMALPLITSVVMPTATQSQSSCPTTNAPAGCPCTVGTECASGCCLENFPGPSICGSTFGVRGCFCNSDGDCDGFECCAPSNPVCSPGC